MRNKQEDLEICVQSQGFISSRLQRHGGTDSLPDSNAMLSQETGQKDMVVDLPFA